MRIDAALPPEGPPITLFLLGKLVLIYTFLHLHDNLQERNYGVNQEVPVCIRKYNIY